ncbi:uncharacterized protein LOC128240735 [Mya arenaria]|uniref:uncharacterized protein LOC128240735 n=1 Tax=Mya arenaria TaxID=6604 RepID=UPI0022E267C1|nr:uncharacterized protein LOC128240735 [Mya arenaria]XP_052813500.1 uncharacterized protein LOC128240735 [Mya arenaria]XP_052813501.1 uncharacterized protein LOC128240735 [Mya arenaria]XP_052813502.1 uncharacterized protein LOC128240735 [Mya arenaria]XP_052813503.1 uncharacterized protein LOC128240735 [Mya arenaria]
MEGKLKFLKYEYPEKPRWMQSSVGPTVAEMLTDIRKYLEQFSSFKDAAKQNPPQYLDLLGKISVARRDLLLKYLLNVQQEEGIGVQDKETTHQIMNAVDIEIKIENSPPLLEDFPSLECDISSLDSNVMSKSVDETKNLYKAYTVLVSDTNETQEETDKQEFKDCIGLLQKELLTELHKVLMDGVMDEHSTSPGHFSTKRRVTKYHGADHEYPHFHTESIAEQTVEHLINEYNGMLIEIKKAKIYDEKCLEMLFKCATSFLFTFLQLHPFADGNGRLARLLGSYSLLTFSPFMTPIYNVFSKSSENDYIDALVEARRNLESHPPIDDMNSGVKVVNTLLQQEPRDLFAMLVESNWTMWRQFLIRLGDKSVVLFPWENHPTHI